MLPIHIIGYGDQRSVLQVRHPLRHMSRFPLDNAELLDNAALLSFFSRLVVFVFVDRPKFGRALVDRDGDGIACE
jgi:hypothetical protein